MIIYLHFQDGTTTITNGEHSGYDYCRSDTLITAHIQIDDYHLFIDHHSITARYKYINVRYGINYKIGKHTYPYPSLPFYKGSEAKHLLILDDMINELIQESTVDGESIAYYRIDAMLRYYREAS